MTKTRIFYRSLGSLFIAILITTMSACGTVALNKNENNEALNPIPSSKESEVPSLQTDASLSLQACSIETDELDILRYWLYTPENPTENMPLIIYLHGASSRGDDLNLVVADEDFPKYLQSGELGNVPAYVLIPQLPSDLRSWSEISNSLYCLIQNTVSEFSIDKKNISLSGFSMGGTAVWELAAAYPDLFSRIAPLAGSARGVLQQVSVLQDISVHAFVGAADTVIAPNSSKQMIAKLKRIGANAQITVLDGADHVPVPALVYYSESIQLVDWLIGAEK